MLSNDVNSVQIEVLQDFRQGEGVLSPVSILNSDEGIDFVVDLVAEKEVGLCEHLISDVVSDHVSESAFVVANQGSVVKSKVGVILVEIDSESVVRMAVFTIVSDAQSKTRVSKGLVSVDGGVKIPLFVPFGNNTIVELQLEVVSRLSLSEKRATFRKTEPEFEFVSDFISSFISLDICFEVEGAVQTFGADFPSEELVVDEVVSEERV